MLSSAVLVSSVYLTSYVIWILATRLFFSLLIFAHARRIDMTFPFLLYANQIAGAIVKIYILFRLPLQRWSNRQDQKLNFKTDFGWRLKRLMAFYLTTVYVATLFFFVYTYVGLLDPPSIDTIRLVLGGLG
jgi:glycosyltransferase Alg8